MIQVKRNLNPVTLIALLGYNSNVFESKKVTFLKNLSYELSIDFLSYNQRGHPFKISHIPHYSLQDYSNDLKDTIERHVSKDHEVILCSCSFSVLTSLLYLTTNRKNNVKCLIGIGSATTTNFKNLLNDFSEIVDIKKKKNELRNYNLIKKSLYFDEGLGYNLNFIYSIMNFEKQVIKFNKIHLNNLNLIFLHGNADKDVQFEDSLELFNSIQLESGIKKFLRIEKGDHRLSTATDLQMLKDVIKNFC